MSKVCDICGKGYLKANLVPRGVGRRVTNRSIKRQHPNLRKKKIEVDGQIMRVSICSSCLKRMKYQEKRDQTKV